MFSLYLNRYNDAREVSTPNDTPIEDRLFIDNITVPKLESSIQKASYVSGIVHSFNEKELEKLVNQTVSIQTDKLSGVFSEPLVITEENSLEKLVQENIVRGDSYGLWKIDEEKKMAIFYQKINKRFVYYNQQAQLTVYWNEENEIERYEQTLLDNLEEYNEPKKLLSPIQAINILYSRNLLKQNSSIQEVNLGYSRLIQLTETQVFAPTWHILAELSDGTKEEYFVNAVEGKIIEIPQKTEKEEVEEAAQ